MNADVLRAAMFRQIDRAALLTIVGYGPSRKDAEKPNETAGPNVNVPVMRRFGLENTAMDQQHSQKELLSSC